MTYQKLEVEPFGRALIETGDLDPVYIALSKCEWPEEQRQRWLMAYWLFYHPGAASYMADASTEELFWNRVSNAARNETPSPVFPQEQASLLFAWTRTMTPPRQRSL